MPRQQATDAAHEVHALARQLVAAAAPEPFLAFAVAMSLLEAFFRSYPERQADMLPDAFAQLREHLSQPPQYLQ